MYTEEERNLILKKLIKGLEEKDEILSVIIVGSGAYGFNDKYSDLDLSLVINDNFKVEDAFKLIKNEIKKIKEAVVIQEYLERKLQLFILDNYLEIDVGYYYFNDIIAQRKNYKILFDKTSKVKQIMDESLEEKCDKTKGTTDVINMKDYIENIDREEWYSIIHSVTAYKRKRIFKCYFELEDIRNVVIDLICKRNNLESKRFRELDKLPKKDLKKVNKIYTVQNCNVKKYLLYIIELLYEEYSYWKDAKICIPKEFLINYVKENI